jgi:hypothetical protein
MFKKLAEDYKRAFLTIIDNKWLFGTVIFFVLCDIVTKIPSLISQQVLLKMTLGNTFPYTTGVNQYAQQSLSEKVFYAIHSIHPLSVLGSITFLSLFSFAGIIIAFLIFYKKIKPLRSTSFCKKVSLYSFSVFALSILIGLIGYFLLQNEAIIILSVVIGLASFATLFILLLTIIESLFISLIMSLLSGESLSFESLSGRSIKFIKTLFLFNIVLYFVSTNFVNQLTLLPSYLHLLIPNVVGYASGTMLSGLISNVSWFSYYFHPLFVIVFILVPLTMAISSHEKFMPILREGVLIARRELGYYLSLTIWTLLLMFILLTLSNFINPSVLAISRPMTVELLIGAIYSLLFSLILLTFYVTAFRNILDSSKKA